MKRIFAWAGILIIFLAFLALIIMTAAGAPANAIMALLFCIIVIPVMLYGYLLILKMRRGKKEQEREDDLK